LSGNFVLEVGVFPIDGESVGLASVGLAGVGRGVALVPAAATEDVKNTGADATANATEAGANAQEDN